jgi:hypothetical protein
MQVAQIIPAIEPAIAHMVAEDNMKFAYENEEIGHMREISKNLNVKVGKAAPIIAHTHTHTHVESPRMEC